jgi:prepilin-type N-terminal cleavage/methylation domain-containing protein
MIMFRGHSQETRSGFTIVELIIVITVIAILASVTLISYNTAQERSKSTRIIAQASAYIAALKLWATQAGRSTATSCIAPSSVISGGVCPSAGGWMANAPYDASFNQSLASYSGIATPLLGEYGSDSPTGLMWYHGNYYSDNRAVLYYTIGPTSKCGLPGVLSPNPGYDNLTLMNADYTARDSSRTQCIIEVFKY